MFELFDTEAYDNSKKTGVAIFFVAIIIVAPIIFCCKKCNHGEGENNNGVRLALSP